MKKIVAPELLNSTYKWSLESLLLPTFRKSLVRLVELRDWRRRNKRAMKIDEQIKDRLHLEFRFLVENVVAFMSQNRTGLKEISEILPFLKGST